MNAARKTRRSSALVALLIGLRLIATGMVLLLTSGTLARK